MTEQNAVLAQLVVLAIVYLVLPVIVVIRLFRGVMKSIIVTQTTKELYV